jgi:hypothetical protein
MAFDAKNNLLQANDGGIARLVTPNTKATRSWASINGNIRSAEFHSIAYDPVSNIVFGGTQDNGSPVAHPTKDNPFTWTGAFTPGGDGGVVGIDADQSHPGTSLRYTSSQFLGCCFLNMMMQRMGNFQRSTWDVTNTPSPKGPVQVGLKITAGNGKDMTLYQFDPAIQFYQPFALNAIDPARMLIVTGTFGNGRVIPGNFYESLNHGDSLTNLGPIDAIPGSGQGYGRPIAYGSRLVPDVFYVGASNPTSRPHNRIFHRVKAGGPITTLNKYPGGRVVTIAMNPQNDSLVASITSAPAGTAM